MMFIQQQSKLTVQICFVFTYVSFCILPIETARIDTTKLCSIYTQPIFAKADLTILANAKNYNKKELTSIVSQCLNPRQMKDDEAELQAKWLNIIQEYLNCKCGVIITKMFVLIEHYSLTMFKWNNSVDGRSLRQLDQVNWASWNNEIKPKLMEFYEIFKNMLMIQHDMKVRTQQNEIRDHGYIMEAINTYFLFLYNLVVQPSNIHLRINSVMGDDKKMNWVRLIHFYTWDLTDKYTKKHCKLNAEWKSCILELIISIVFQRPTVLESISKAISKHITESKDFLNTWNYDTSWQGENYLIKELTEIPHPGRTNIKWIKTLNVKALWHNGITKSIMEIYQDVIFDFRPTSLVQYKRIIVDMILSIFFRDLYEYIVIYVVNVMVAQEKNVYFGINEETDPFILKPIRKSITEMMQVMEHNEFKKQNSMSKNTLAQIYKNISFNKREYYIENKMGVAGSRNTRTLVSFQKHVNTLSVVDLLLTLEILSANYKTMGILVPKHNIKVFSTTYQAHAYLFNNTKKKLDEYIQNIKLYCSIV